jgi:hypothetical protein
MATFTVLAMCLRERNTLRGDWLALGPYRSRCTYLMRA